MEETKNVGEVKKPDLKEVRKKIYSMILPITIENVLQMTAGFVSMAFIGRLEPIAIVALGLSMRITQIIWALFKGVTTGAAVFVAQAFGANNMKKMRHVTQQTLLSSIILVLAVQQFIFWKASFILKVFDPEPILLEKATMYLRTVSWGLPFVAIMLVVAGVLQAMGNAKTPMKIALIMNGINIFLSFLLIFGRFGFPALGLKGAAIALVLAQLIAALLGLYILFNRDGVLSTLRGKEFFALDFKEVASVYKVGAPTALEAIFWQISAIILTRIILTFGETAMAAYQLGLQAESISYMPAVGFGVAATAFIGQALGARDKELGKSYMKELIIGASVVTSISTILLIFFPSHVMGLLTDKAPVIDLGVKYLILMGLVQFPQNIAGVFNGALRGAGYTRVPMYVAGAGLWIIRIPFAWILTYVFNMDIIAIWVVMSVDLICRFFLSLALYKTRDIYNKELVFEEA